VLERDEYIGLQVLPLWGKPINNWMKNVKKTYTFVVTIFHCL
jgi:hypothetical protein